MATINIAGLVEGASKGEGLGNQFLGNIREVDALVHIVRCFENENITHVNGFVDPIRYIETINTELLLADIDSLEKRIPNLGLIEIENNESNIKKWVNTSSSDFNQIKEKTYKYKENELQKFLKKINTNYLKISSDSDYVKDLIKLFKFRNNN